MTENCKFRKAISSAFYNISQRNFGVYYFCNALSSCDKIFVQTCLDQNFSYKGKGPFIGMPHPNISVSRMVIIIPCTRNPQQLTDCTQHEYLRPAHNYKIDLFLIFFMNY